MKLVFLFISLIMANSVSFADVRSGEEAWLAAGRYRAERQNNSHTRKDGRVSFSYPTVMGRELRYENWWMWMNKPEADTFCQLWGYKESWSASSYKPQYERGLVEELRTQEELIWARGAGHIQIKSSEKPVLMLDYYMEGHSAMVQQAWSKYAQPAEVEGLFSNVVVEREDGADDHFREIVCTVK